MICFGSQPGGRGMSVVASFYRAALFAYFIDPLFYISSFVLFFFCAVRFFCFSRFFSLETGSSELRAFFESIPYVSSVAVPLLVFRLRRMIFDDSVPISPFGRFSALVLASFTCFSAPVVLLCSVPLCVRFFGTVDAGQTTAGFLGIVLYGICAISLSYFLFCVIRHSPAAALMVSVAVLAVVNSAHLVPVYFPAADFVSFLCRQVSFAWHFDSFAKGIVDTRNIVYYAAGSFSFMLLSVRSEYRRIGRKYSPVVCVLFVAIVFFCCAGSENVYFRIDITKNRLHSVSDVSREIVSRLQGKLRVTYIRSPELRNMYPQTKEIEEFLSDYCSVDENLSLTVGRPDPDKLSPLGIHGQQIRRNSGTRTEFATVYSAIIIQYFDTSAVIPFVLSTRTLEYDVTQRVKTLLDGRERTVYVLCGNGRSVSEFYSYLPSWLSSRGFVTEVLDCSDTALVRDRLTPDSEVVVLGHSQMSYETSEVLRSALEQGTRAFIAAGPLDVAVEGDWSVTKTDSAFIHFLNSEGFSFGSALVADEECVPLTLEGQKSPEYTTVSYPLWISVRSQSAAPDGMTLFWASPIFPYGDVHPVLYTSHGAWLEEPDAGGFLTNPFMTPKSAAESDASASRYVVAAGNDTMVVVSDQYFVSSLMTGFISSAENADFRNYDFLAECLLRLRGEDRLADLMRKKTPSMSLQKITDQSEFTKRKREVLFVNFVLIPLFILLLYAGVKIKRNRK